MLGKFVLELGDFSIPKNVYLSHHQGIDKYSLSGPYKDANTKHNDIGRWIEGEHFLILV
jgi:hypothetical protein